MCNALEKSHTIYHIPIRRNGHLFYFHCGIRVKFQLIFLSLIFSVHFAFFNIHWHITIAECISQCLRLFIECLFLSIYSQICFLQCSFIVSKKTLGIQVIDLRTYEKDRVIFFFEQVSRQQF